MLLEKHRWRVWMLLKCTASKYVNPRRYALNISSFSLALLLFMVPSFVEVDFSSSKCHDCAYGPDTHNTNTTNKRCCSKRQKYPASHSTKRFKFMMMASALSALRSLSSLNGALCRHPSVQIRIQMLMIY